MMNYFLSSYIVEFEIAQRIRSVYNCFDHLMYAFMIFLCLCVLTIYMCLKFSICLFCVTPPSNTHTVSLCADHKHVLEV